ncbi:shikimate kinase [Alkalihalobacillus sp. AL-G]|uniref:shikimate kinase n=1 Tax=Alkalihalobacillus sp. AL-G TaxID=2926399 RepID=UPI00272974C4|nr:shikimate kinase [Alkalihalobacillus sp. AL-G]WLD92046.1 shikimate kinase [Alkalihalobacillus sp. AL-G]
MDGGVMRAIYITGFMAAGKTSIGKELGIVLDLPVIDTDQYIEEKLSWDIPSIFERKGEVYFRDEEQAALLELPNENVIITTGGGIVLRKENRCFMKENGCVISLETSVNTIVNRLQNDLSRPLVTGKTRRELQQLFEQRQPYYHDADLIIDTEGKSIPRVASEIVGWIKTSGVVNTEY